MLVGFRTNEFLCTMKEVCTNAPFASICTIKRQNGFHHYSMGPVFFFCHARLPRGFYCYLCKVTNN